MCQSSSVGENLEGRAGLAQGLASAVELAFGIVYAANEGFYFAALSVECDYCALRKAVGSALSADGVTQGAFSGGLGFQVEAGFNDEVSFSG